MRIQIASDGTEYVGTPVEIVTAMRGGNFQMHPNGSMSEYIASVGKTLHDWYGLTLPPPVDGGEEQQAEALVRLMLEKGLAREVIGEQLL